MSNNTINKKEIEKFNKIAEEWWNPNGKFKPLHKFNPIRIEYIKNNVMDNFNLSSDIKPFKGISVLDIGCGGGLLSEPMARLGANVVGIDASKKNIDVAKHHLNKSNLEIEYYNSSPENFNSKRNFDVILNMEIVEHVDDVQKFISESSKFLSKNGIMFIATLNQTLKSYVFAILGAEYILRWLPIGTHDWNKFIKPKNLKKICETNMLKLEKVDGIKFNPILNKWTVSKDKSVNYISVFKKI
tara:strand:- start:1281 stop:2009 length:729 start_codon:yes stop_codon:yes gene_type:complete